MGNTDSKENVSVLSLVLIGSDESGGYTAFINEYPEAIAEGRSIPEAVTLLGGCLEVMFKHRKEVENEPGREG